MSLCTGDSGGLADVDGCSRGCGDGRGRSHDWRFERVLIQERSKVFNDLFLLDSEIVIEQEQ
jgi:hypothetical protein